VTIRAASEQLFQCSEVELVLSGARVTVLRPPNEPLLVPIVDCYGEVAETTVQDYIQKANVTKMRILEPSADLDALTWQLDHEALFAFFRRGDGRIVCGLVGWKGPRASTFIMWQGIARLFPGDGLLRFDEVLYAAY